MLLISLTILAGLFAMKRSGLDELDRASKRTKTEDSTRNNSSLIDVFPNELIIQILGFVLQQYSGSTDSFLLELVGWSTISKRFSRILKNNAFTWHLKVNELTAPRWLWKNPALNKADQLALDVAWNSIPVDLAKHLILHAEDIETVDKLLRLPSWNICLFDGTFRPIGKDAPKEDVLLSEWLFDKVKEVHPSLDFDIIAEGPPLFLQVNPLTLIKAMAMESVSAFYRLTPTFLFVLDGILRHWKIDPTRIKGFISHIYKLKSNIAGSSTFGMKVLQTALIIAGLAGDRTFASVLPDDFWSVQSELCKLNFARISILSNFFEGRTDEIPDCILETNFHQLDEMMFGFMGFDRTLVGPRMEQILDRLSLWPSTWGLIWHKGTGDPIFERLKLTYYAIVLLNYSIS